MSPWAPAWALALLALAGPACTPAKERKMSESTTVVARECAGRFCLGVPPGFARKGGSATFGHVELVEAPLPGAGEAGFAAAWTARLAAVAARKKPHERAGSLTGKVVEDRTLGPGFRAALYHDDDRDDSGRWGALLTRDGRELDLECLVSFPRSAEMLQRITAVGGAWRPRKKAEPWPIPGQAAFYLPSSAVVLPFKGGELASARFEDGAGMVLRIETDSTVEPDKKGLLARLGQSVARAGVGVTAGFSTVRTGGRTAAGLEGEELVLRGEGGRELICAWRFPGDWSAEHRQPRVDLALEAEGVALERVLAVWDKVVESLAPAAGR